MFQLNDVSKCYSHQQGQVTALQSTTLHIAAGEFVAVVGPSGSGKTTLLSILGGMLAPTSGRVLLDGISVYDAPAGERARLRLRRIGFVSQTFNLVPYLSALENVQIPLMLSREKNHVQVERAAALLKRVGLAERVHHKPSELSVGQQQRVALARTLVNDPSVILADEPTGNLDPQTREHVLNFLGELCREGRTVLMVTHDPSAAERAGRTLHLADGSIRADTRGRVQQVA
jgi:putative ABC transport system ATP-binding protein